MGAGGDLKKPHLGAATSGAAALGVVGAVGVGMGTLAAPSRTGARTARGSLHGRPAHGRWPHSP